MDFVTGFITKVLDAFRGSANGMSLDSLSQGSQFSNTIEVFSFHPLFLIIPIALFMLGSLLVFGRKLGADKDRMSYARA